MDERVQPRAACRAPPPTAPRTVRGRTAGAHCRAESDDKEWAESDGDGCAAAAGGGSRSRKRGRRATCPKHRDSKLVPTRLRTEARLPLLSRLSPPLSMPPPAPRAGRRAACAW